MTKEDVAVKNESNDHIYFIVTPRLVWALCTDPFEYTFWNVVKDIAGEKGQCILSRDDLATLAMMSGGKASACRDSLIRKKLLVGDFRRDPGYPQPVWHLSIPDFWEANVRWARKYISLRERIAFKRDQAALLVALKETSSGDGSGDASSGDGGVSPRDRGVSPDDLKKNVFKNQEEEEYINQKVWKPILDQLQKEVTRGPFENYVRDTQPFRYDGNTLTVATISKEAQAWLESRLTSTVERLLIGILNAEVEVKFVVAELAEAESE